MADYTMQGEDAPPQSPATGNDASGVASDVPDSFNWDKFATNTTSLLGAAATVIESTRTPTAQQPTVAASKATSTASGMSTGVKIAIGVGVAAVVVILVVVIRKRG